MREGAIGLLFHKIDGHERATFILERVRLNHPLVKELLKRLLG